MFLRQLKGIEYSICYAYPILSKEFKKYRDNEIELMGNNRVNNC